MLPAPADAYSTGGEAEEIAEMFEEAEQESADGGPTGAPALKLRGHPLFAKATRCVVARKHVEHLEQLVRLLADEPQRIIGTLASRKLCI